MLSFLSCRKIAFVKLVGTHSFWWMGEVMKKIIFYVWHMKEVKIINKKMELVFKNIFPVEVQFFFI